MSGKQEQTKPNVSRETTDDSVAMLNEILDRATPSISELPEEKPSSKGPAEAEDVSRETPGQEEPTFPAEKNKRSSVYVYLAVLFGAAFLMLLLAYFVQQRNNETTISGLQSSWNLSREELMQENDRLEEENAALQKDVNLYQYSTTQAREQYENERQANAEYQEQLNQTRSQLTYAIILGYLEQFINEGDYLMAACVVEQCDQHFNENNWIQLEIDALPTQVTRYMELRDWLYDNTYIAMYEYPSDNGAATQRTERPVIAASTTNASDKTRAICVTARNLWGIIWSYSESRATDYFYNAAISTAIFCHPEKGTSEQLYSKAFQSSTIALFEQIKADLMDQGLLVEQDGLLYFADDSGPVDFDLLVGKLELTGAGSNNEDNAFPN